jgi:hypothetical protein
MSDTPDVKVWVRVREVERQFGWRQLPKMLRNSQPAIRGIVNVYSPRDDPRTCLLHREGTEITLNYDSERTGRDSSVLTGSIAESKRLD